MDAIHKLTVWIGGLCLCCLSSLAIAQEASSVNESRTARSGEIRIIQIDRASIYAGPNADYYPTSQLEAGDSVEVFERTEDGWLAIRPPKGSFSWLPASQGLLLPGGRVVEVTDKAAVSWIGTSLGKAKQYRWQVRLGRGEQLAVIGEQTVDDPQSDAKTLWYKITPPDGEFRWIREEDTAVSADIGDPAVVSAEGEEPSAGTASSVSTPAVSQSVLTTSFEDEADSQSIDAQKYGNASRQPRGNSPASATNGVDPWSNWHAIEFDNGNFSFPGIARMFGYEPAPVFASQSHYDPFDLSTGVARSKPQPPNAAAMPTNSVSQAERSMTRVQGWRDPRELRELRQRGGRDGDALGHEDEAFNVASAGANATGLDRAMPDQQDMASGTSAVGTGVIATSATGPVSAAASGNDSNSATDDAAWYGIRQAPQQRAEYKPLALSQADISQVQLSLSEMVSGPQSTWNLAPLADRTRYLIEHGATAVERGEARLLMDRIEAFTDLARRSTELGLAPPVGLQTGAAAALAAPGNTSMAASIVGGAARWASPLGVGGQAVESATASALRFDATGWIVQVRSSGRDLPTHALTNDAGTIIVYLSPAPGVNLGRYQGQAVGVYGLRGYLPQLKSNHIQVQRAVRLQ